VSFDGFADLNSALSKGDEDRVGHLITVVALGLT
jgi:hypothetical protein